MKLFYEIEDSIVGIILGALLLSPILFKIPYSEIIFPFTFGLFLVLNIADIRYCLKDFRKGMMSNIVAIVMNFIDVFLNLAFLSKYLSITIPFITENLVPMLNHDSILVIATYLIVSNMFWILDNHSK